MTDIRLQRLADLLVNYSAQVKPGQWVGITGDVCALPALRETYRQVLAVGGHPTLLMTDDYLDRIVLREANQAQLSWVDPVKRLFMNEIDAYIRIAGIPNIKSKANIPAERFQMQQSGQKEFLQIYMRRMGKEMRTVVTLYPTEGWAQQSNMSLEEYEDFVYGAYFCDMENPADEWRKLGAMQQKMIDWLNHKKHVRIKGPRVDLELSIEGRTFINDDGTGSISAGEIYTGPVEDSINGHIYFDFPSLRQGQEITGIELHFEKGKVVLSRAEKNEAALNALLDADEGARCVGEFAFGTNYRITKPTGQLLFDEKMGGTIHLALGAGYPETGSRNKSAIHWDIVCDLRKAGEIFVDGDLFFKNGQFVI